MSLTRVTFEEMLQKSGASVYIISKGSSKYSRNCIYKRAYDMAKISGYIAVDTETSVVDNSMTMMQICVGDVIIIQQLYNCHRFSPICKRILSDPDILKIFFDMRQDIFGIESALKTSVTPSRDLQILTRYKHEDKLHGLKDALTRVDPQFEWYKPKFSQRGFNSLTSREMLKNQEFIRYAAADAFATYTGCQLYRALASPGQ